MRLLEVCRTSQNPFLHAIVTLALHTGMRRGKILGLTWERIDFARGVIRLEETRAAADARCSAGARAALGARCG